MGVVVLENRGPQRLAIRNLWLSDVRFDVEFALHAVNEDVEVQFTHSLDDGLTGLLVEFGAEGRVFFSELLNREAQLFLVSLGLGLDRNLDNGLRESHRLEDDRLSRVAQRVPRSGVLESDDGVDVTSGHRIDRVFLVGVHLENLSDALFLVLRRVDDLFARIQLARVHANVSESAEERVDGDLERESRERFGRGRLARELLFGVTHVRAFDIGDVEG